MATRIALTVGDPRGIGPEIAAKVLRDLPPDVEVVTVGPVALLDLLPGPHVEAGDAPAGYVRRRTTTWHGAALDYPVLGGDAVAAGLLVRAQVERAVQLALAGEVDAIVTGPAEKHALQEAGVPHPGHTEWLAALTGAPDVAMMLTDERLRVVLVTTHLALRDVPSMVTRERLERVGNVTLAALRSWWGIPAPRLALCALNPHVGEGGMFGDEDQRVLGPAAAALGAIGPLPADTVFVRALRGEFDAVLTPYHDVGMTAIKVAAFGTAVNVTLGLPIIRTAPDHGTAFDIAGTGVADPGSLRAAVGLAARLAGGRTGRRADGPTGTDGAAR
jgi:4-hydroxythreonine-4-phosphate dehydrogenase